MYDESSFERIFNTNKAVLHSVAFYLTRNEQVAEDIVQEAFLRLWKKRSELTSENISGWLYRVASNLAYKHLKKEAMKEKAINILSTGNREMYRAVEEQLIHKEGMQVFRNVYARLPEKQQKIYHLSKEVGLSRNEIARHLHMSANTVRNHLYKTVQLIREHIMTVSVALLFFVFHNLIFRKDSTNTAFGDLYKIKRTIERNLSERWTENKPLGYPAPALTIH